MHFTCPHCKRRVRSLESAVKICPDTEDCGYDERYANYKPLERIYLVDANIIINALNRDPRSGSDCQEMLLRTDIATTEQVISEIKKRHDKDPCHVFKVKKISPDVKELKANMMKQPSEADLSLIQAAIDNPGIIGIISYDPDFFNVAAKGIVLSKSSKPSGFWVGTAKDFLKKGKK
jgi:hypothetical protein